MEKVSIITPIFNKKEFTMTMLEFLVQNTKFEYEIIIVDNASTDGSHDEIVKWGNDHKDKFKGKIIRNSENKGFSIANNQASKIATGDYLCFLNNDTIPLNNWLTELVATHKRNNAGITGSKLIIPGQGIIQHAGIEFDKFKYPYHIHYGLDRNAKEVMVDSKRSGATGACLLISKELFDSLGGFDENYWLGWEDVDLCNRVTDLGKEIWYSSKSELYHYESMSDGRYAKESDNWYYYSKRWVFNI